MMKNLKRNILVVSKWREGIWRISTCALESLKNLQYIMFALKKYRGVIFHDTGEWYKLWRKADLWFGKWHEEFGKFSLEHWKVSKLTLWWIPFFQSRKCMSLKFTEELYVMKMKNKSKFEEVLPCQFKIDMRNLANLYLSTEKSQKFEL